MNREDKNWITASSIRNYILNDPLCDWLDKNKDKFDPEQNPALEKIMDEGKLYEEQVLTFLKHKYGHENVKTVCKEGGDIYDMTKYEKTLSLMRERVPIIYQGALIDFERKIGGICDLLILSSFFNQIVADNEGVHFINEKEEHYVVVDIKSSRLSLAKDGLHLQNSRSYTFYKGQLYIYTEALKKMQNFDPIHAYILGKGWEYTKEGQKKVGNNALQRMARVDFHNDDLFIVNRVHDAVEWNRKLRKEGDTWILYPPSIPELRPNMKVVSAKWQTVKKEIAEKQEDVTLLYHCGDKKRILADEQNVQTWKNVRAENLNIKSKKIKKSIERSITVNQTEKFLISPRRFSPITVQKLSPHKTELYLDYETFFNKNWDGDVTNLDLGKTITYLIGCGFVQNGVWSFKTYILNSISAEDQKKLFFDWVSDIVDKDDMQIYSWGPTEKNLFEKVTGNTDVFSVTKYTDLLKVCRDESIAMTGLHGYSLKNMAKAMYNGSCIKTTWPDCGDVKNGLEAMQEGERLYSNLNKDERDAKLKDVEKYNEVDCKVMWEIVSYFRENHF